MASALASPPPPWSFGASDLKRNARKFLERALVISALVHLAAVGAFRAAYERSLAREAADYVAPWSGRIDIAPRLVPPMLPGISPPHSTEGVIVPEETVLRTNLPTIDFGKAAPMGDPGPPVERGAYGGSTNTSSVPPPPFEAARPFGVAEIPPEPIIAPRPSYPEWAMDALIEGRVVVRVLVGVDGLPKKVVAVSGPKALLSAAAEGVQRWKFRPGMTGGQPVEVWVEVPVVFRLQ